MLRVCCTCVRDSLSVIFVVRSKQTIRTKRRSKAHHRSRWNVPVCSNVNEKCSNVVNMLFRFDPHVRSLSRHARVHPDIKIDSHHDMSHVTMYCCLNLCTCVRARVKYFVNDTVLKTPRTSHPTIQQELDVKRLRRVVPPNEYEREHPTLMRTTRWVQSFHLPSEYCALVL